MAKNKKIKIIIATLFDRGLTKYIAHLDRGIKRAKAFTAALRRAGNSAPFRLLRNGLASLVGTLVVGTMEAAKFNIQMARAWSMSKKGADGFKIMRQEVRELAAELGLAKAELADGLYQALSAGVPEDNVFSFLKTSAKIAVADGTSVAVAVDGLTTVLNAFKIDASETDRVADQMFNTVANGKTTFDELARTLATVAPIAAANNIAFEEVLASVATLTKQGTPTAQAMTQIRAAIIGTNKVLGDGWAKTMSLQDGFKQVNKQAGGSQNTLLKLVGSIEAVQGVLGTTGENARVAAEDLDATTTAAGAMGRAFDKVDQFRHWNKLWQSISGLVERTGQEVDSRLAPAIMQMVEGIASIQGNDELWGGLGDTLDEAAEKITGLLQYIKTEGAKGVGDMAAASKDIVIGLFQMGAEAAAKSLLYVAPRIGTAIGNSIKEVVVGTKEKRAFFKQMGGATNIETRKDFTKEEIQELWLKQQGKAGASRVGNSGRTRFNSGLDQFKDFAVVGDSNARLQQEEKERARSERIENIRRAAARKTEVVGRAEQGYDVLKSRVVGGKNEVVNAALHGTTEQLESAQINLQSNQEALNQLKALATRINKDASGGPTQVAVELINQFMDGQAQRDVELNRKLELLASQIKNGRS